MPNAFLVATLQCFCEDNHVVSALAVWLLAASLFRLSAWRQASILRILVSDHVFTFSRRVGVVWRDLSDQQHRGCLRRKAGAQNPRLWPGDISFGFRCSAWFRPGFGNHGDTPAATVSPFTQCSCSREYSVLSRISYHRVLIRSILLFNS